MTLEFTITFPLSYLNNMFVFIQQIFRVPSHVPGIVLYIADIRKIKT